MPVRLRKDKDGYFYQWGNQKKYYFKGNPALPDSRGIYLSKPLNINQQREAYKKAHRQGQAISISKKGGILIKSKSRGNLAKPNYPEIQSIIFNKNKFTKEQARQWLKDHGFKTYTSRNTKNFIRWRQKKPKFKGNCGAIPAGF